MAPTMSRLAMGRKLAEKRLTLVEDPQVRSDYEKLERGANKLLTSLPGSPLDYLDIRDNSNLSGYLNCLLAYPNRFRSDAIRQQTFGEVEKYRQRMAAQLVPDISPLQPTFQATLAMRGPRSSVSFNGKSQESKEQESRRRASEGFRSLSNTALPGRSPDMSTPPPAVVPSIRPGARSSLPPSGTECTAVQSTTDESSELSQPQSAISATTIGPPPESPKPQQREFPAPPPFSPRSRGYVFSTPPPAVLPTVQPRVRSSSTPSPVDNRPPATPRSVLSLRGPNRNDCDPTTPTPSRGVRIGEIGNLAGGRAANGHPVPLNDPPTRLRICRRVLREHPLLKPGRSDSIGLPPYEPVRASRTVSTPAPRKRVASPLKDGLVLGSEAED